MQAWNYWTGVMSQLDNILKNPNEEEKQVAINKLKQELSVEWSTTEEEILQRFIEIGIDINVLNISAKLLTLLKEAIYCYLNNQNTATVASCGIAAEVFCSDLYQLFLEGQGMTEYQIRQRIEKFNGIGQSQRIDLLSTLIDLGPEASGRLLEIKKVRDRNVHPSLNLNVHDDARICLKNLIEVLHLYSNYVEEISRVANEGEKKDKSDIPSTDGTQ